MSVVSVREIVKRGGNFEGIHEKITRAWEIKVNSVYDNTITIAQETVGISLPSLFSSHPNNIFATCRSLQITQVKGLVWKAVANYSTEPLTQAERERAEEPVPIDRAVRVSWSATSYDKVAVKDIDDNAVVNSAGDYYDPPPAVAWERLTFHFRKNFQSPEPWILEYCNSVNSADISILGIQIPAGMARFSQPRGGEEQEENGQFYHETTWDIEADVSTWQLELLDEGLREKDGTDRVNIDVISPVLLDGAGARLVNPTLENAVYNDHKVYYEKDYTLLPGIEPG